MKKYILVLLVFVLGFGLYIADSKAQVTPSASVTWDKSQIAAGGSATETWTVVGFDPGSIVGHCFNGDGSFDSKHSIPDASAGPQSFTFSTLIKVSMTCEISATANGVPFSSGEQKVTVSSSVTPPTPPAGGSGTPTCFFDQPGTSGPYYVPSSDYTAQPVPSDADASKGVLGWKSVSVKPGQAWITSPALDSSYTASLSGGSFNNTPEPLAKANIQLNRSELMQFNKYTLSIKNKDGTPVTSCSVQFVSLESIATDFQKLRQTNGPVAHFPAGGSYPITTSSGTVTANYNYAPPMPRVILSATGSSIGMVGRENFDTFLGQFKQAIYFAVGHFPSPVGKWDLTDPFHPTISGMTYIGVGGTQSLDNAGGPLVAWLHKVAYQGMTVAEDSSGNAAMLDWHGHCEPPLVSGTEIVPIDPVTGYPDYSKMTTPANPAGIPNCLSVMGFPTGGQPFFGQQIDENKYSYDINGSIMAAFATPDGSSFGYTPTGAGRGVQNPTDLIRIFPLSDTSHTSLPPYLDPVGTINWPGTQEIHITNIPGRDTQFIIARTVNVAAGMNAAGSVNKPVFRIAQLNNETGKIAGTAKVLNFILPLYNPLTGLYPAAQVPPSFYLGSNIQSATVNGSTYIFLAEQTAAMAQSPSVQVGSTAKITIGAYKFNPTAMSVTRVGSMKVNAYISNGFTGYFKVLTSDSDTTYPLIAVGRPGSSGSTTDAGLDVYSTKILLGTGGNLTPTPNFNVQLPAVPAIMHSGDVAIGSYPYQGFLKEEGSKVNLYLYHNAFQWNGVFPFDSIFSAYDAVEERAAMVAMGGDRDPLFGTHDIDTRGSIQNVVGSPSLRVDQIDVTSLATTDTFAGNNNQGNNNQNNNQQQRSIVTQSTAAPFADTRTYTWTTTAPNNGDILWGVNWGDTSTPTSTGTCPTNPPKGTGKNWTFTTQHTWDAPGNYTIKVYASDCVNPTTTFTLLEHILSTVSH